MGIKVTSKHEAGSTITLLHSLELSQKAVEKAIIRIRATINTNSIKIIQPTLDTDD